jgi:AcrR family transcriptional regulator
VEEDRRIPASGEKSSIVAAGGRRRRGRPRSERAHLAVIEAAGELLLEVGLDGFTIDAVAARSGVSKATIYKWWPSKGAVALDGFFHAVDPRTRFPDTGSVREDFAAQLRRLIRVLRTTPAGRIIAGLIAESQHDPALAAEFRQRWLLPRRQLAEEFLRRGQERGELRQDFDPEVVIDQVYGPLYHRLLSGHLPLRDDLATKLVDNILPAIAAP